MKNICFVVVLCTLAHIACAQSTSTTSTTKVNPSSRHWVIGVETDNLAVLKKVRIVNEDFQRRLIPTVGYKVTPNLVLGVGIPLGLAPYQGTYYSSGTVGAAGAYPTTLSPKQIGLAPFIQQFIGRGKLRPFFGASYRYSYQQLDFSVRELSVHLKQTGNESELALFGGLTYWVTARLGLDVKLRYGWQNGQHPYISFPNRTDSGYTSTFTYSSQTASVNVGLRFLVGHQS